MKDSIELIGVKEELLRFTSERYPDRIVQEDTILFEMINSSIEFIMYICDLEERFNVEIHLENIDDFSKLSLLGILEYI